MAKAKTKKPIEPIEKDEDDNLDALLGADESEEDLLGGEDDDDDLLGEKSLMEMSEEELDKKAKKVTKSKEDKQKEKEAEKARKAEEKKNAPPKELKGVKVTFKNKAGETITGNGVLYYVVRMNGKLHYKEASQVTLLD